MDELEVLRRVEDAAGVCPTTRLVALYAIGSLGHGGFSPMVSDVDLALVLSDPLGSDGAAIASALQARLRDLPMPVSVFWDSLSSMRGEAYRGRFPAADRWDLCESGRLIAGTDIRREVVRPSLEDVLACAVDLALIMLARPAKIPGGGTIDATPLIRDPAALIARGPRDASKLVLLPLRFLFTLRRGVIRRLDEAIAIVLRDETDALRCRLIEAALRWRTDGIGDTTAAISLCRASLVPIYLEFIDAHRARLSGDSHRERVAELASWRERLTQ